MGAERAREETGLSFCFCQHHIGEKNKTRGWKGSPNLWVHRMLVCGKDKLIGGKKAQKR